MSDTILRLFCVISIAFFGLSAECRTVTPRVPAPLPEELNDTKPFDAAKWEMSQRRNAAWANTGIHYSRKGVPERDLSRTFKTKAWKGETVNAEILLWTTESDSVTACPTDLKGPGGAFIPADSVVTGWLHYVMTDEVSRDPSHACSPRPDHAEFDSTMVADVIDTRTVAHISPRTVQPLWVSVNVPRDIPAGIYTGEMRWRGSDFRPLKYSITVVDRTLPLPHDRKFWLDLWQNPYAVARYYNVPLWSEEHWMAMRDAFEPLAAMGQKCITAPIVTRPWGGQTEDAFESMIGVTKNLDGSWSYDYQVFDKWIEFMIGLGIDRGINCYSLVPWPLTYRYFDRARNNMVDLRADIGTPEYEEFWAPFLTDMARHLKAKGWFDIATIAMDERPLDAMQKAITLIRKADPDFRVALAGNYHEQLVEDVDDYCVILGQTFTPDEIAARRLRGQHSTVYTCCVEAYPNTFTCSPPAEAMWLPWYAASADFDGYLRWAYNSWVKEPLQDTRFRAWAAGDCFLVYPGARKSVRLAKLDEGIQDFEKILILKEEFASDPSKVKKLKKLNDLLNGFNSEDIPANPVANWIPAKHAALNDL